YGRIAAYENAGGAGEAALAAALKRNLFAGADAPALAGMVAYVDGVTRYWHAISMSRLVEGRSPDPGTAKEEW
ncbi:MAG: ubiquinol-cytochrome C chaperone family protein, partial [Burkholderiales bacterium]